MTRPQDAAVLPRTYAIDPACGALVDPRTQPPTARYRDAEYSFCSLECRTAFVRNPAAFVPRATHASNADAQPLRIRTVARYGLAAFLVVVVLRLVLGLVLRGWPLAVTFVGAALLAAFAIAARLADNRGVRL